MPRRPPPTPRRPPRRLCARRRLLFFCAGKRAARVAASTTPRATWRRRFVSRRTVSRPASTRTMHIDVVDRRRRSGKGRRRDRCRSARHARGGEGEAKGGPASRGGDPRARPKRGRRPRTGPRVRPRAVRRGPVGAGGREEGKGRERAPRGGGAGRRGASRGEEVRGELALEELSLSRERCVRKEKKKKKKRSPLLSDARGFFDEPLTDPRDSSPLTHSDVSPDASRPLSAAREGGLGP